MENDSELDVEMVMLSPYDKIKVYWDDIPMNYSKEAKLGVRNHFATKYGVNKNNVTVIYRPIKHGVNGDIIEITGAGIENIMDVNYQRSLMQEIIARDGRVVDFNRIIALDDKVNKELNIDLTVKENRKYEIKWIMINNLLCFGESNYVSFTNMDGLTIVESTPKNTGGKTSFTIDAFKFLFYGNTTKSDKNEDLFNLYSGNDNLSVRGMIKVDEDVIIERKLKRSRKKDGSWNITNTVNYYEVLPDGSENLMNDENSQITSKKIKESIGNEKDFELLALATEKNLDDLIGLTTTESGKVLTRLIGLEILELKESAARFMYNEFAKKKKSNEYDVITLSGDIIEHEENIEINVDLKTKISKRLSETISEIFKLKGENDKLLISKEKIDIVITQLNPSRLESDIEQIISDGKLLKLKEVKLINDINVIGVVIFDEDTYNELTKKVTSKTSILAVKNAEVVRLNSVVTGLIDGGVCQSCKQVLTSVNNSEHINTHNNEIAVLKSDILILDTELNEINNKLVKLNETKILIDQKNRLELSRDRTVVEMDSLRNSLVSKRNDLTKYKLNLSAIDFNIRVDSEIDMVKTQLAVCEQTKSETIINIEKLNTGINTLLKTIDDKKILVDKIKKEDEIEKIFKVYIDLVGKKGISKIVLRSVLPIINSELQRLLDDACDFDVEIYMDDKNDVKFLQIKDDVQKPLKACSGLEKTAASLALRAVLGKLSTLPMPNFITFDEVFGKIAAENIEKLKGLFDKIKGMYDIVFLITHNDLVREWADDTISIVKENNISTISFK